MEEKARVRGGVLDGKEITINKDMRVGSAFRIKRPAKYESVFTKDGDLLDVAPHLKANALWNAGFEKESMDLQKSIIKDQTVDLILLSDENGLFFSPAFSS